MDNSRYDSQSLVFALVSPPKKRIHVMTAEDIYEELFEELTRVWEKTKIITTENTLDNSKTLEICLGKFKHYRNELEFNNEPYKHFFFESDKEHHLSFIQSICYLRNFFTNQINLLESYLKISNKLEENNQKKNH
ncbi:UNVERIFIED_CONTAM: hypothetical protein RMT77_019146 [Armadillidium vulgare]